MYNVHVPLKVRIKKMSTLQENRAHSHTHTPQFLHVTYKCQSSSYNVNQTTCIYSAQAKLI